MRRSRTGGCGPRRAPPLGLNGFAGARAPRWHLLARRGRAVFAPVTQSPRGAATATGSDHPSTRFSTSGRGGVSHARCKATPLKPSTGPRERRGSGTKGGNRCATPCAGTRMDASASTASWAGGMRTVHRHPLVGVKRFDPPPPLRVPEQPMEAPSGAPAVPRCPCHPPHSATVAVGRQPRFLTGFHSEAPGTARAPRRALYTATYHPANDNSQRAGAHVTTGRPDGCGRPSAMRSSIDGRQQSPRLTRDAQFQFGKPIGSPKRLLVSVRRHTRRYVSKVSGKVARVATCRHLYIHSTKHSHRAVCRYDRIRVQSARPHDKGRLAMAVWLAGARLAPAVHALSVEARNGSCSHWAGKRHVELGSARRTGGVGGGRSEQDCCSSVVVVARAEGGWLSHGMLVDGPAPTAYARTANGTSVRGGLPGNLVSRDPMRAQGVLYGTLRHTGDTPPSVPQQRGEEPVSATEVRVRHI